MFQLLKELMTCPAVSGGEKQFAAKLAELIRPHADKLTHDAFGNLIAFHKGKGEHPRRVLLAAHMDSCGYIVNEITAEGMLRLAPVGKPKKEAAAFSPVVTERGVRGVLIPAGETLTPDGFFADVGAKSAAAAGRRVKLGDTLSFAPTLRKLAGDRVCGTPLDDRVGCAVLLTLAAELYDVADDLYFVFTAESAVGNRGAGPAAFGVSPDLALTFDLTPAGDFPGGKGKTKLGAGPAIKLRDKNTVCCRELADALIAAAKTAGVAVQYEINAEASSDAGALQMSAGGCRAGGISIPCRYPDSGVETVDLADARGAVALAAAFLKG